MSTSCSANTIMKNDKPAGGAEGESDTAFKSGQHYAVESDAFCDTRGRRGTQKVDRGICSDCLARIGFWRRWHGAARTG